eukprot:104443-Chlamydomonas_euryale.AAC.1
MAAAAASPARAVDRGCECKGADGLPIIGKEGAQRGVHPGTHMRGLASRGGEAASGNCLNGCGS